MKKGIFSIFLGIISSLGIWGWWFLPRSWIDVLLGKTVSATIFYISFFFIGLGGLICGIFQIKEKKFKILAFFGIFICVTVLLILSLLILIELGIIPLIA